MPPYQLHVAIAQAASAAGSLAAFTLATSQGGKNALPTSSDGEEDLSRDPFNVTKPEDFVDGTPIDEDHFWARVRLLSCTRDMSLIPNRCD